MNEPKVHRIPVNDIHLTVYEWGSRIPDRPDVIFLHATGFHARCWDEVIRQLDDFHCYAVDARGHGASDKPQPPYTWQQYGQDTIELVQALKLNSAIAVGHSMGGNSVTRAAAVIPEAFAELILVDPVIIPRANYDFADYQIDGHFVLNRRREWQSVDEMYGSFKGRGPFANWQDQVLQDYCEYGIVPNGSGYVLACSPEVEAHIYSSVRLAVNADIYAAVEQVDLPVRVLRCGFGFGANPTDLMFSPTAPDLAAHFRNGTDFVLTDNSHFIPMESPEVIVQHVRDVWNAINTL